MKWEMTSVAIVTSIAQMSIQIEFKSIGCFLSFQSFSFDSYPSIILFPSFYMSHFTVITALISAIHNLHVN